MSSSSSVMRDYEIEVVEVIFKYAFPALVGFLTAAFICLAVFSHKTDEVSLLLLPCGGFYYS